MEKPKYAAQAKHLRENYVQFKISVRPEILEEFKRKCKDNGTTPTTEIKRFIAGYCGGDER